MKFYQLLFGIGLLMFICTPTIGGEWKDVILAKMVEISREKGEIPTITETPKDISTQEASTTKEENISGILTFGAEWCPSCKQMQNDVWQNEEIIQLIKDHKIKYYYVDADKNTTTADLYKVSTLPVTVFVSISNKDKKAQILQKDVGYLDKDETISRMKKHFNIRENKE